MTDGEGYINTQSGVTPNSNRMRSGMIDLAMGRTPISSLSRSIRKESFTPAAHDHRSQTRGQRTETRFLASVDKKSLAVEAEAGHIWNSILHISSPYFMLARGVTLRDIIGDILGSHYKAYGFH